MAMVAGKLDLRENFAFGKSGVRSNVNVLRQSDPTVVDNYLAWSLESARSKVKNGFLALKPKRGCTHMRNTVRYTSAVIKDGLWVRENTGYLRQVLSHICLELHRWIKHRGFCLVPTLWKVTSSTHFY